MASNKRIQWPCLVIAIAATFFLETAVAQIGGDYVEDVYSQIDKIAQQLTPALAFDQQRVILGQIETKIRAALEKYPDRMAPALQRLAANYLNINDVAKVEELQSESYAILMQPIHHDPDALVGITLSYADYLVSRGKKNEAVPLLEDVGRSAAAMWPRNSAFRQRTINGIVSRLTALGYSESAQKTAGGVVRTNEISLVDGATYWQSARYFWAERYGKFHAVLFGPTPDAARQQIAELDGILATDFAGYPYEQAEGHISVASALQSVSMLPEAKAQISLARGALEMANVSYPDVDILMDLVDAEFLEVDRRFDEAFEKCSYAMILAGKFFEQDSRFSGPVMIEIARLMYLGGFEESALSLSERIINDYTNIPTDTYLAVTARNYAALGQMKRLRFDLVDKLLREAVQLELSAPDDEGLSMPPGGGTPSKAELDRVARSYRAGRYAKTDQIVALYYSLAENDLNMDRVEAWFSDISSAITADKERYGDRSDEYIGLLLRTCLEGRERLGLSSVEQYAERAKAILRENTVTDTRLAMANYCLRDDSVVLDNAEFENLKAAIVGVAADKNLLPRLQIELERAQVKAGKVPEALETLRILREWRKAQTFEGSSPLLTSSSPTTSSGLVLVLMMKAVLETASTIGADDPLYQSLVSEAFDIAQLSRPVSVNMALSQLLPVDESRKNELQEQIRLYQECAADISREERILVDALSNNPGELRLIRIHLDATRERAIQLESNIRVLSRNFQATINPGQGRLQSVQASLSKGQALLFFVMSGPRNDRTDRWRNGATFVVERHRVIPIPLCDVGDVCDGAGLFKALPRYLSYLTPIGGRGDKRVSGYLDAEKEGPKTGFAIYQGIWKPIETVMSETEPVTNVSIVSTGMLQGFPFAALVTDLKGPRPRWLVEEKFAISYLASIDSTLRWPKAPNWSRSAGSLVAFADPSNPRHANLRDTAAEICDVANVLRLGRQIVASEGVNLRDINWRSRCAQVARESRGVIKLFTQKEATSEKLFALSEAHELEDTDVLAFATHGVLTDSDAHEPGVILTPSVGNPTGNLGITDIVKLRLSARLVILSACNTADSPGFGLRIRQMPTVADSFIQAGAKSVLATFTAVSSAAAREVVVSTMGLSLQSQRFGVAKALQAVMKKEIAIGRAPDYWAPFAYFGGN